MSKNAQILLENLIEQEFQNNDNYSNISDYFEFFSASQILKNQGLSEKLFSDRKVNHEIC